MSPAMALLLGYGVVAAALLWYSLRVRRRLAALQRRQERRTAAAVEATGVQPR